MQWMPSDVTLPVVARFHMYPFRLVGEECPMLGVTWLQGVEHILPARVWVPGLTFLHVEERKQGGVRVRKIEIDTRDDGLHL